MNTHEMIETIRSNSAPENYSELREALDHCLALLEAEAEERLLVLPCGFGADIYTVVTTDRSRGARACPRPVKWVRSGQLTWLNLRSVLSGFGETVFLTREEAEAALEGANDG